MLRAETPSSDTLPILKILATHRFDSAYKQALQNISYCCYNKIPFSLPAYSIAVVTNMPKQASSFNFIES
jgi:hypothetical protein